MGKWIGVIMGAVMVLQGCALSGPDGDCAASSDLGGQPTREVLMVEYTPWVAEVDTEEGWLVGLRPQPPSQFWPMLAPEYTVMLEQIAARSEWVRAADFHWREPARSAHRATESRLVPSVVLLQLESGEWLLRGAGMVARKLTDKDAQQLWDAMHQD
jgi:hypothetical protein